MNTTIRIIRALIILFLYLSGNTQVYALEVTEGPTLTMNPNGITPLAGVVQLSTDVPVRTTLVISDGAGSRTVDFPAYDTVQSLSVLGLKPDTAYSIEMIITDQTGSSLIVTPLLQVVTEPLPDNFPTIEVSLSNPSKMEPGFTLLDRFTRGPGVTTDTYTMIVDNAGQVVWYSPLASPLPAIAMRQLPNGNLSIWQGVSVYEMDMLGNEIERVVLDAPLLHHDLFPKIGGGFIGLNKETVVVENYPTSDTDPNAPTQTAEIQDNPVVEFAADGTLLNTWRLTDMLSPTRIGYEGALTFINDGAPGFDWAHANTVVHDPSDDSIMVSVRSQDAVVKFSRTTGDIKWILGPHANWTPEFAPFLLEPVGEPFEWQYHQHAPMLTSAGTWLMFDNGNKRASPFDGNETLSTLENYSRAVEYAVDEETMTVRQVWEYGFQTDEHIYASALGDADLLQETGNVLINFGYTLASGGIRSVDQGKGIAHARIIEVDHNTPAEKVFDMTVYNPNPTSEIRVYRTDRIGSLYPPDVASSAQTDSDGDLLGDEFEANVLGTDPFSVDSDNDGLADGLGGLVPLAVLPGGIDMNADGFVDGEQDIGTSPTNNDSDGDRVSDGDEIRLYGIDPLISNTGDVSPRGSPDNVIDRDDLVVLSRLINGQLQPTALELILGDMNNDGQLNIVDRRLLKQAILSGANL